MVLLRYRQLSRQVYGGMVECGGCGRDDRVLVVGGMVESGSCGRDECDL